MRFAAEAQQSHQECRAVASFRHPQLVKRYTDESGSVWVRQISDPSTQHTILLAEITLAEVSGALAAKHRAPGGITQEQRDRVLSRFLQDCAEHFVLLPVDRAVELTQRHRLRGYDVVQLATALVTTETIQMQNLPSLTFVAADGNLHCSDRRKSPHRKPTKPYQP